MEHAFTSTSLFKFISRVFFNKTNVNLAGKVTRISAEILFSVDVIKLGER